MAEADLLQMDPKNLKAIRAINEICGLVVIVFLGAGIGRVISLKYKSNIADFINKRIMNRKQNLKKHD